MGGVPVEDLLSALAQLGRGGEGVEWEPRVWSRLWSLLSATQQRVVFLHVVCGMSQGEVAHRLKLSRTGVAGAFHRAVHQLRGAVPRE